MLNKKAIFIVFTIILILIFFSVSYILGSSSNFSIIQLPKNKTIDGVKPSIPLLTSGIGSEVIQTGFKDITITGKLKGIKIIENDLFVYLEVDNLGPILNFNLGDSESYTSLLTHKQTPNGFSQNYNKTKISEVESKLRNINGQYISLTLYTELTAQPPKNCSLECQENIIKHNKYNSINSQLVNFDVKNFDETTVFGNISTVALY